MIQTALVFLVLLFFILLGFPIFMFALITTIIFIVAMDIPFSLVIIRTFGSISSFSLMTTPFFVLTENIMAKARITDRLVDFANTAVGQLKDGLGYVNIPASILFGGIQGSGTADTSVIGGMLIPTMEEQRYNKDYAAAITTRPSMPSPIISPNIAMVLCSFYTGTPVAELFLGGLMPGILIDIIQYGVNYVSYRKRRYDTPITRSSMTHFIKTFWKSLSALIMPLIILLGIVFDIVTPTGSGVLAVAYGLIYGFFVSRRLKVGDLPKVIVDSVVTTAVVFMTISTAGTLADVLVRIQLQWEVLSFAANTLDNPYLATLFLVIVFMILECFLDPAMLITMLTRVMVSARDTFGFDPIHYDIIMIIVMQVGAITPPVGTFLFIACGAVGLPLEKNVKPLVPYILVILAAIALMILVPGIVTFLSGPIR